MSCNQGVALLVLRLVPELLSILHLTDFLSSQQAIAWQEVEVLKSLQR